MNSLKFLLLTQQKRSKPPRKSAGFTLIELLVAIILAALVITPLLGFMINILSTDRKEQAKATSEQEIQTAADYIARDLQQAVYIYDAQALNNNLNLSNPTNSGIKNQLPSVSDGTPVLVFWKRELVPEAVPIDSTNCKTANDTTREEKCNDTFVYSLVAYYLIKDNNTTWSDAARIARFQISDGVKDSDGNYIPATESRQARDAGFAPFNLGLSGSLRSKMNRWDGKTTPATNDPDEDENDEDYTNTPQVLVDYIDHTTGNLPPNETCPSDSDTTDQDPEWTKVPDYSNASVDDKFKTNSFYACVYSSQNIARVYLRGNALARIQSNNITYDESTSSYFPTAKIQVEAIGGLGGG